MRGELKVMVGKDGAARVQETVGDSVKIYSAEDWAKELEARKEAVLKAKVKNERKEEVKTVKKEEAKAEKPKLGARKTKSKK